VKEIGVQKLPISICSVFEKAHILHVVVFGLKNVQYVASLMQHGQEKKPFGKLF
jgi:hypothetical protein